MKKIEKNYKCICSNPLITGKTPRDKFYNEWRVSSDENGFLDYKESIKSKEEYEAFKDKIYMMHRD